MKKTDKDYYGYTRGEYQRFRTGAWSFLLFFSLLYCSVYCIRLNLTYASELLIQEYGITKSQIGIITSTLFWTYGFGQLINGWLSDKKGPQKFILLGATGSILVNLLMTVQNSFWIMVILWGVNGYVQSMIWAPGIAILTRWWPKKERGFATGIVYAFTGFGQVAAILTVTLSMQVHASLGWKTVFLIPTAFPVAGLILYLLFTHSSPEKIGLQPFIDKSKSSPSNEEEMKQAAKTRGLLYPYRYVLSDPHFFTWIIIIFLVGIIRHGLATWTPIYFIERYGVDINNGLLSSMALPLGMGAGTITVPWLTDHFCSENRLKAVVASAFALPVMVLPLMILNPSKNWQHFLIELLLFFAGFFVYAISGTSNTYATDVGGRVFSGTASGILSFSAYMGAAIQSLVYGFLLDTLGWNVIFISVAVMCVLVGIVSIRDLCRHR